MPNYRQNPFNNQRVSQTHPPLPQSLSKEETASYIDSKALHFGKVIADKKMKAAQLRKFYHELKAYESKFKANNNQEDLKLALALFKAKVAYNVKRQASAVPDDFYKLTNQCINLISNDQNKQEAFANFLKIMEAVVAYHKFSGGAD